jgi:hypothetical protein
MNTIDFEPKKRVLKNQKNNINVNNKYEDNNTLIQNIFKDIKEFIEVILSNKNLYDDNNTRISLIDNSRIYVKLPYLDNYIIYLTSKNLLCMQKELNDEESKEENKKMNQPHKICNLYDGFDKIMKELEKNIDFLVDLNKRTYVIRTFEHRINNFFKPLNKDIFATFLMFDEEPSFELTLPVGDIYFSLLENDILEIDYNKNIDFKNIGILGNEDKVPLKVFGGINKGFQKISHYIMTSFFNTHIYQSGNRIMNDLEKIFKERFKRRDDFFIENLTPHFYRSFRIDNIEYNLSIEENGEVYLHRNPYIFSDNLSDNLITIQNMRLNKKIGLIQHGYKDTLVNIVEMIRDTKNIIEQNK